jgi:hypothetical protein
MRPASTVSLYVSVTRDPTSLDMTVRFFHLTYSVQLLPCKGCWIPCHTHVKRDGRIVVFLQATHLLMPAPVPHGRAKLLLPLNLLWQSAYSVQLLPCKGCWIPCHTHVKRDGRGRSHYSRAKTCPRSTLPQSSRFT